MADHICIKFPVIKELWSTWFERNYVNSHYAKIGKLIKKRQYVKHLEDFGCDLRMCHKALELRAIEVRNADMTHEPFAMELLELTPRFQVVHVVK